MTVDVSSGHNNITFVALRPYFNWSNA